MNILLRTLKINPFHVIKRNIYSQQLKTLLLTNLDSYTKKAQISDEFNDLLEKYKLIDVNIMDVDKELSLSQKDQEMSELMMEEKKSLISQKEELLEWMLDTIYTNQLQDSIPQNTSCLFEISSGVGGKEAMLFANELSVMYENFFNYKQWTMCDKSFDSEGEYMRHYKVKVEGLNVWNYLKYETGVHRVQRVPKTETKGRIHTSTIAVACVPLIVKDKIIINEKDLKIETKRASGAGGQHVNKTESAVRITHLPTGVAVESQEDKSQIKNRENAMRKLNQILADHHAKEAFEKYIKTKKSQVGHSNRNEKIRTYNFQQDRITDHRLSQTSEEGTIFNLEDFLNNPDRLENFINAIRRFDQEKNLIEILSNFKA